MKKLYYTLILALSFLITSSLWSQGTVTATYSSGDIPSDKSFTSLGGASTCAGLLDVVIPAGDIVTSVDVAYDMTAGGGAWMSEQKSWLYCSTTAIGESALAGGAGAGAGTINYSRTGLAIADGASGTVSFEMHAGRTWGGSGCGTNYNKIDDGTWTITVNHSPGVSPCFAPSGLTASNITTSSADISWTAGGTETSWNFDYGPTGYTQGQGSSTIAANPNSLFVGGANATWSYIHPLVITTDGAASQAAQTYTINVTSLPASGAKARLIKSTANGGAAFSPAATGQALVLGANTFTATAVSFNRYVKIQFNNDQFEFDSIAVNGTSVYTSGSSVSTTSASLSGLTSNTTYDAYVQADCGNGDVSSWFGPFSFTTLCGSLPAPFSEGFSSTLPSCWSMSGGENWLFNTSGPNHVGNVGNLSGSTFSGGHYAVIDASGYSGANGSALLESPIIDVSSLTSPELTFYLISNEEGTGYSSTLTVEVNGGSSWDTVGSYTGNTAGWEQKTIDLSAYTSTVQLRFGFSEQSISSAYYDDIAIDDIDVHETPSCFAASGLSSSNLTATTADLSWTATNSSSFTVEYGLSGFSQGSGTSAVVSASVTIADNPNSLFYAGPAAWPHVSNLALTADGATSQPDQTFTINVTSLPAGGTNWRLIKQNQSTGASFVPTGSVGQPLVLGVNTLTAPASTWNRYVKAQFQNNTFEFDAISINGISVYSSSNTSLTGLSPNTQYDFYVQNDCGVTNGTATWSGPSSFTTTPSPTIIPSCEDFETGSPGASTALNAAINASATVIAGAAANSSAYGVQLTGPDAFVSGAWSGGSTSTTEAQAWGTNVTTHSNIAFNVDATAESVVILTFDLRQTYTFGPKYSWFRVTVNGTQIGASINPISNTDPFVNYSYDLSAYAGTSFNLKLEHAGKYSPAYSASYPGDRALIDNICISAPNCLAPTALTASAITATTANVSWTVNGTETAWDAEYGPFGFTQGAGTISAISSANTSLTGLTAQTQYDVYVRADCGSGSTSSWVGPITFTTACAAAAAPYLENFDAGFPVCWTQSTADDFNWTLDASGTPSSSTGPSDDITGGGNYMFIETSGGTDGNQAVLFSQAIDLSALTVPQLVFQSHMFGATINTLSVDISADAGVTFTQLFTKTGDQGNQWNEELVDLSNYSGTVLFRITASQGTSFTGDIAIDDFEIRETPSCSAPTSLSASNLTTNSADLSWTAGGTETAWNFEYGPVGFIQGSGTSLPLASANTSLTGLTTDTQYHAYVQADCGRGNTSVWVGPYTFSTLPNPSCRYTMNMIDSYGDSWNGASIDVSINGAYVASFSNPSSAAANAVYTDTISAYTGDSVSFSWTSGSYDGEVSFEILDPTFTSLTAGYIAAPPAGFFLADANSPSVCAPPACQDPILLTASNLTPNSADISWTAGGTETAWNFEYGPAGFTQGTGTISALSSANTSLTGLIANTQYDVYVQADCGSGSTSGWTGPFTFTTACSLLTTFPYTMDFENGFGCWSTVDVNGGNSWGTFTAQGLGGTIAAGIQYQSSAHDDHLISPKFSVTSNSSRFSFNATDYFGYPESFDILVSTTGKAAADFTDTISSEVASGGYSYYQYDLSSYIGQDVYVSIHSTSTNQYYLFVDDVTIDEYVSKTITQNETSCDSYTWSVNGTSYTSDTSLTVFSPAVDVTDADSTFILNLTVNSSTSSTETITACDSLSWNGTTYITSGNYSYTTTGSNTCDSTVNLVLTIINSTIGTETITACDSSTWNGTTYTTSGNYSYTTTGSNTCDSTVNLVLTVNSSTSSSVSETECGTYVWSISQTTYNSSGVYINSDTTPAGCSKIDTLVLTINPEYNDTISVTACDTYTWLVNGNTYTSSTTSDSLYQSINGCDSLVTLDLTIINSTIGTETITACDSATWNGTTYTTGGNYSYNNSGLLKNNVGCDSTSNLTLTLNSSSSSNTAETSCGSYNWVVNGSTFNYDSSGTYINSSLTPVGNCPQIDTLVLTINPEYNDTITLTTCDTFAWDGVNYTTSGLYTNPYTLSTGCDSLVTYDLTINNSTVGNENITACDSATWNGTKYYTSGSYSLGGLNNNVTCDSTSNVNLTINYSSSSLLTTNGCISYTWNGQILDSSGLYTYTNTNALGCPKYDSLDLTITTTATSLTTASCDSFPWNGQNYTTSGIFYSSSACVDTLFLTINSSNATSSNLTVCDTLTWIDGITYSASGTYNFITSNNVGCDSSVTLNLTVDSSVINLVTDVVCDSTTWNGTTYTTSGNYSYTTTGSNTCDSTVNLALTVNSSSSSLDTQSNCGSYNWIINGNTYNYTSSGVYTDSASNAIGCPQYDTLLLTINPEYNDTISLTACDTFAWDGVNYTTSDTITRIYTLSTGCDSIVTYNLTINSSSAGTETITACDSATWNGTTYTISGNYFLTGLTNNFNCDSTSNLVLSINYSSSSLLTTTSCNSYFWKGNLLDSSGIYSVTGTNLFGCNQYDTLDLTISTFVSSNDIVTACDSYDWGGLTYFTSGTYTQAGLTSSTGCDSTANLNLTINSSVSNTLTELACDSYNWNGMTYTTSGVYTSNFQTSNGCDSTVNLVLTINSSSNQSVTVFSCDEYVWDGVSYTASGDYTNNYTTASGCDSTVTLVLTIGTTAAPFTEGFDINFPNCWSQPDSTDGEDALDWTRNSFATFSPGTGPSDDVIGGGHYMYIESSLPAQHGDNAIMYSNFIDISSLTYPELRFFSHMYGESTGSLTVEIQGENDTVPTTIFSKSGDHGDLWVQERVVFTSTSNRVRFKITGILDSNSLGAVWAGDMAIDEFGVREAVPNDLAIIAAAVNSDCELTTTEPIELWVVNNGLVDQANFKLSYSINGGAPVLDSIIQFVNIGDTLRHIFTTTADMSMDGIYDIDFECILAIDADATDNILNFVAENYTTPADAVTEGDTICFVGDFGQISAISDGWIYWYDSLVGGSLVGENDTLSVAPSATTSYFAEVSVYDGFEEDFESYSPGDLIAQTSNDWNTWSDPNGGADDDAEVTDFVSAGGSNSLYLNDDNSDDIVLPLGNTYSSGTFNFETDMYIETNAYLNFQEGVVNGDAWAFDIYFNDTTINVEIDDSTVLTVAYNPNNPLGAPVWFNFGLEADLDNGQWKMFKDGVSLGSFSMNDEITSVNFWASTGNDYYIDNVKWSAWGGEACRSLSRTEAVVVLDSCNTTTVSEVSFENLKIYPNPNNGSFTIANSEPINGVVIMDLRGKVVYRNSNLNLYNLNVNLENLDRGMYMINIISENEIITKSIIVN